ncbi:hypothetical protein BGZ76_000098 [Entomortierella beljakovae]|nr:hypothetical protein BGZ76_000098 [Entomortierella beljakovae]
MTLSPNTPNSTPTTTTHSNSDNSSNLEVTQVSTSSTSDSLSEVIQPNVHSEPTNLETTLSITETTSIEHTVQESPVDSLSNALSSLSVDSSSTTTTTTDNNNKPESTPEKEEELSPEEASLKSAGLKSTHRPGFYIHINSPRRLRIQTKSRAFDLDRYCPHANADLLKWGVLRTDSTLRCGVHYWGFDLVKNGQCIAHPDETLNACPAPQLEW